MNQIKKVKGFTLGEMLVVLLLTTIVVASTFTILQLVQQQMNNIENNYARNTEYNLLRRSLWVDFHQNDGIWYDKATSTLYFKNEIKEVAYQLGKEQIVKGKDTFKLGVKEHQFFFKGNEIDQGEIDALDFSIETKSSSPRLFVFKTNASTSILNE